MIGFLPNCQIVLVSQLYDLYRPLLLVVVQKYIIHMEVGQCDIIIVKGGKMG
jgi:hypothetical protein